MIRINVTVDVEIEGVANSNWDLTMHIRGRCFRRYGIGPARNSTKFRLFPSASAT